MHTHRDRAGDHGHDLRSGPGDRISRPGDGTGGPGDGTGRPVRGAVITVSDRSAAGAREDTSGPLAAELLAGMGVDADVVVVPDGIEPITRAIAAALDGGAGVVVTTGGTGVGPRDVTPEATEPFLARQLPGVAEAIRARGAAHVPTAVLSRGLAGLTAGAEDRPPALLVNVPGSPGGVRDALAVLAEIVPHVLDQLVGGNHETA